MRVPLLAVAVTALALKARSDFDKVELSAIPQLSDTAVCVQSQAAMIAVSPPEELRGLYFRRGYCALAGASITRDRNEYLAAAADFDRATLVQTPKNRVPEPVSGIYQVLSQVARLHATAGQTIPPGARRELELAVRSPMCNSVPIPPSRCEQILEAGRQWVGWMALGDRQYDDAARYFSGAPGSGWLEWVEGQRQFQQGRFADAAAHDLRAIETWKTIPVEFRLGPQPDLTVALADLGGAQLLAGDTAAAIASLDASLKANPSNPAALYRRALAHDRQGRSDLALADYNMASRAAFAAAAGDVTSGEAHLYRGIMLYRRKDFARAENEFSSALNLEIPMALRPDAEAWRHLSAVATGACDAARWSLDASLPSVSPYFPKQEAMQTAANCH